MKKLDEKIIWQSIMTVMPVVILMNVGKELTNDTGMEVLYSGLFGGIGGLIGFVAHYFTQNKSRLIKGLALLGLIFICGIAIYFISSNEPDEKIISRNWISQQVGLINFEAPNKLELKTNKIPESVKGFYEELSVYTDNDNSRITTVMSSKIKVDTIVIEDYYTNALIGMLNNLNVDLTKFELEKIKNDNHEISSRFSIVLKGEKAYGYGYMFKKGQNLESAWLIPIERGFSQDYIDEFEAGIIPVEE